MKKNAIFLLLFLIAAVYGETFRIITPYGGQIENELNGKKDDAYLNGLYFQWIDSEKFQGNIFVYYSKDINFSNMFGTHAIFDYYFNQNTKTKDVIGIGANYFNIDTEMEGSTTEFESMEMEMDNNIFTPYIRGGRYFYANYSDFNFSLLPWLGFEYDIVKGDVKGKLELNNPFAPLPIIIDDDISKEYYYLITGLNFKVKYSYFADLKLKYSVKKDLNRDDWLKNSSIVANIYLSRNWGISYRYKHYEATEGDIDYNIAGISFIF